MPARKTLECDLKTEVNFVPRGRTLSCDLKTEVDFSCRTERTLERDLKTEVDFPLPCRANFKMRLKKSTLDCHAERTLHVTTVVDFMPCRVDLR
jgi:hypothetical protein